MFFSAPISSSCIMLFTLFVLSFVYLPYLVSSICSWPVQCFFICVLIFYPCRGILCPYVTCFKFVCALHHAKGDGEGVLSQGLQDCGFWHCHSSWGPLKTVLQVCCGSVIGSAFQGWILVCFQEFAKLCIILFHSGSLDGV